MVVSLSKVVTRTLGLPLSVLKRLRVITLLDELGLQLKHLNPCLRKVLTRTLERFSNLRLL